MCTACKNTLAQPLTAEAVAEFHAEGIADLLVEIDGQTYSDEDLYHCAGCGLSTPDRDDLDDDRLCEACAEGAREYAAYVEDVRWTYWHSVL